MDDRRAFVFGSESVQAFLRHFGLESELFYWLREMAILGRHAHWNLAIDNHRLIPIGQTTSIRPWKSDPDIVLTAATAHECAGLLYKAVFEVVFPEAPEFEDEGAVDDWLVRHKAEISNRTSGLIEKSDYSAMLGLAAAVERERILALKDWKDSGTELVSHGVQPVGSDWMQRIASAVGGPEAKEIMRIAESENSTDEKMQQILRVDRRWAGKGSPDWATLLRVSEGAVRKSPTWKQLKETEKAL